jgi:hypothetical protein
MKKIIIIILFFAFVMNAEDKAQEITEKVINKINQVDSYRADLTINVDVDFVQIKERKAKVYYKKPDVFEIDAEGFALLPKSGTNLEYIELLRKPHTAIYLGEENTSAGINHHLKIIPTDSKSEVVLAELWIEKDKNLITKMQTYTKNEGKYTLHFEYAEHPNDLPDIIIIEFEIQNSMIPSYMTGQIDNAKKKKKDETTTGKVIMQYSNYKVN